MKVMGLYTGFSEDRSSGIIFGLKLPSGDHTYANFDPDTEIGTGSTDVILGAYHVGKYRREREVAVVRGGHLGMPLCHTVGIPAGQGDRRRVGGLL